MTSPDAPESTGDSPPSLRERKREQTRRAILEACVEIELLHGGMLDPERLTYARIAEVAGVSERTVYRFFPSKRELDEAYTAERPLSLGVADPETLDEYADVIEEVTRQWSRRVNDVRVAEQELGAEDYPIFLASRRRRDRAFVAQLREVVRNGDELDDRQLLALAGAVYSAISVRTLAITAQRWNLTIEEAGRAHAWALRTLLDRLRSEGVDTWEARP